MDISYAQAPKHSLFHALDIRPRIVASCRATRLSHQSQAKHSTDSHILHKHNGLLGRTAMITGGSSGIGYAIAERFLEEGASKIILVGRRREKLQNAADRLAETTSRFRNRVDHQLESGIATRAPEEDDNESKATEIALTSSGQNVEYLVGDISVATEWMADLEKAMVSFNLSFLGVKEKVIDRPISTGECRYPSQCRGHIYIKSTSQDVSRPNFGNAKNESGRRNLHFSSYAESVYACTPEGEE